MEFDDCTVCRNDVALEKWSNNECVHYFCYSCTEELKLRRHLCPLCRKPWVEVNTKCGKLYYYIENTAKLVFLILSIIFSVHVYLFKFSFLTSIIFNSHTFPDKIELYFLTINMDVIKPHLNFTSNLFELILNKLR